MFSTCDVFLLGKSALRVLCTAVVGFATVLSVGAMEFNSFEKYSNVGSVELERTFLARAMPKEITGVSPKIMLDTYFPEHGHAELRVRQNGDSYEITKKVPLQDGLGEIKKMQEMTIPLSKAEFDSLTKCGERRIYKHRYNVVIERYPAEVDVFQAGLKGLVMIDFEFSDLESAQKFIVPEVCLADVTRESFKAGGVLAGKSYKDIEKDLIRFNYNALF